MNTFTYEFEDLEIVPDCAVYASGEADISYVIRKAEPDVGIMSDYIDNVQITAIVLRSTKEGKGDLNIIPEHPLYGPIEMVLDGSDALLQAVVDHADEQGF